MTENHGYCKDKLDNQELRTNVFFYKEQLSAQI